MNSFLHSHRLAQKLNNTAALCIETGQYDRGISCLVEALQLSDQQSVPPHYFWNDHSMVVCQCRHCSLDECIVFSERTPLQMQHSSSSSTKSLAEETETDKEEQHDDPSSSSSGYVHRRPIRITPQCTQEGHYMGVTLSLIITFNLALAHHLSALKTFCWNVDGNNKNNTAKDLRKSNTYKQTFQKILHLYELAYRWQIELEEDRIQKQQRQQEQEPEKTSNSWDHWDNSSRQQQQMQMQHMQLNASSVASLRFNMIISNNLSQIHRLVQNHSKHQRCLEHLLATMMFVVVSDGLNQQRGQTPSSSSSSTIPSGNTISSSSSSQQYMDFEGFLCNVTTLMLRDPCAGAA
jgi:hypothetical protein